VQAEIRELQSWRQQHNLRNKRSQLVRAYRASPASSCAVSVDHCCMQTSFTTSSDSLASSAILEQQPDVWLKGENDLRAADIAIMERWLNVLLRSSNFLDSHSAKHAAREVCPTDLCRPYARPQPDTEMCANDPVAACRRRWPLRSGGSWPRLSARQPPR
jgi:hypothetical protein